ncbi:DNA-directed RNA polymerase subunit delta [Tenuibacillus multivorans]|uniref:Probable DNA-directed RNA polymerase subunit delta n=1 Tax=Tenuibacillus multivorans TaxID=237069 RepID=A0A1G9X1A3_9BACI|nr:DNA-directed RNA polymerase subunit delta [Tenuibacillus multivorans]GEL77278.1 DNA-directed RNA polymerase subunit delta [Tenuibacillus multivorans]SDM90226.1 DNA-directed RNA polymerase subunit delta [Tenuibacillus multivorans]
MTLEKYSKEDIQEVSMVQIAYDILSEEKKAMNFNEVFDLIAEAKEYTQEEKEKYIVQFYTDLNIDGRFMSVGSNIWGLKDWYPFDQQEDDTISFNEEAPKKKKKKKKNKKKDDEAIHEDDFVDEVTGEGENVDDEENDEEDLFHDELNDEEPEEDTDEYRSEEL